MKRRAQGPQSPAFFGFFILMLGLLIVLVGISKISVLSTIFISLVLIVFALLIMEAFTGIWTSKLGLYFGFVRLEVERNKEYSSDPKRPHELRHFNHSEKRPKDEDLFARARALFEAKQFKESAELYHALSTTEPTFWPAQVNEQYALILSEQFDAASERAESIRANCKDKTLLAQTYVNEGDSLMIRSEKNSSKRLEEKALANYRIAYKRDPKSIGPMLHYWLAEVLSGHNVDASVLAKAIRAHKDYDTLGAEEAEYFERVSKTQNQVDVEDYAMTWKKLLTAAMPVFVFAVSCALGILNTAP